MRRGHEKVNFVIEWNDRWAFWCDYWTPIWHEGRGPYLTMCLGRLVVMRGY